MLKHRKTRGKRRMSYGHDVIANRLAKKLGTKHRRKGVDIVSQDMAREVAVSEDDIRRSVGQLKQSRASKKYMVVPRLLIPFAKKLLRNTGIGVMNTHGSIKKRSRKRRRRC